MGLVLAEAKSDLPANGGAKGRCQQMVWGGQGLPTPDRSRPEEPFSGGIFVHADRGSDGDPKERLFWDADIDPAVLSVEAEPISRRHIDAFDITRFAGMADLLLDARGNEMLVLDDGGHQIQLNVTEGTLIDGPVRLRYHTAGFLLLEPKLRTLARLHSFQRLGRFSRSLFAAEPAAPKWARALQAWDGAAVGATQREIACAIYGDETVRAEWGGRSEFLKARTQRLIRYGKEMVDGGYRRLLT